MTEALNTIHGVTALASFLTFLYNGRYRTLLDRILRLRLVTTSSQTSQEVSFEYLNRQLVWHAFTEFLLFLLPLVGIARWRRILSRTWRRIAILFKRGFGRGSDDDDDEDAVKKGELGFLPERTCAICYADQNPAASAGSEAEMLAATTGGGVVGSAQTDITNPYEAIPCGCVYCFVCLAQRIEAEEGEGWTCLRCGELVKECKPWSGDVLEEQPRPSSNETKSVGFEDNVETIGVLSRMREEVNGASGEHDMHEVEPMPTDEETDRREAIGVNTSGLSDSAEWARASEVVNGTTETEDSDEQSEEFDEDEEDLGEDEIE